MCWERLAQLHDILKLSSTSGEHFRPENYPQLQRIKEAKPELWMALNHHQIERLSFPLPREAFWICLADHKASAISRRLYGITGHRQVFRVWKDEPLRYEEYQVQPREIDLDVAALLATPIDPDVLYARLRPYLRARSESTQWRGGGCPFASLDTHGDLTRRWFAFFNDESDYFGVPPQIATVGEMWALRMGDLPKKSLLLLRLRVRTAGRLARLRDAVVLADIPDVCQHLAEAFGRHTIYDLHDETLIVVRPAPWEEVERRLQAALGPRTNYFLEVAAIETPMGHGGRKKADKPGSFLHNFPYLFGLRPQRVYPCLPAEIAPDPDNEASREAILCDLCQMAEARVVYPRDVYGEEDPAQEYLCLECVNLRKWAPRLPQLAAWEESEEDVRICFVKVSLDLRDWWEATIRLFQQTFPEKLAGHDLHEEDLGFSILAEFLADYGQFLDRFRDAILALPDCSYAAEENHQEILSGLLALRIHDDSEARAIVKVYLRLFEEFFPKWRQEDTPIRLSVSCSNVKFPFLEHWDFLDAPQQPINVQSVRRARLEVDFAQWDALQALGLEQRRTSAFLHRLAEIEARTGSVRLVEVELLDKRQEFRQVADPFRAGRLQARHILDYYKIAGGPLAHE